MFSKIKCYFLVFFFTFFWFSFTNWYFFGLKSANNTIENIQKIEAKHNIRIPLVAFIFDPRWSHVINIIGELEEKLWKDRIYHITISPNNFSAQEVADWSFDLQYELFFQAIKDNNLKVVFRTMHEMNWWRYPRSSDPENFKKARIHIREISRKLWLSQENILFDFSVNHWDMPTKWKPNQAAKLIQCQLSQKEKLWCYTFEDYYPGDKYVDLVGFSFYNRGKWFADRKRLTPNQIVYERWREPLTRLKTFNKPIIIDEVWTTSVWYEEDFDISISREFYKNNYQLKNTRLRQLQQLLWKETSIVWTIYFNVDYTKWLTTKLIWEADWSVIDLDTNKVYNAIFSIFKNNSDLHLRNPLLNLFGFGFMEINWKWEYVPIKLISKMRRLESFFSAITPDETRQNIINKLWKKEIKILIPSIQKNEISQILNIIKNSY